MTSRPPAVDLNKNSYTHTQLKKTIHQLVWVGGQNPQPPGYATVSDFVATFKL